MKKIWFQIIRSVALATPLILGVIGFVMSGESFLDSMFISVCLYGMEYQDPTPNTLVEIARWTAPLATASGILMIFTSVRRRLHSWLTYRHGDSVAVYGPEQEREALIGQLGARGIEEDRFVHAHRYILMNSEEENFGFYEQNRQALEDCQVYMACSSLQAQSASRANLHLFCPEETAARLFWKRRCLYETSAAWNHQMKIVFLGFGRLGEELLIYGLQNNIFDPKQHIEYHIFGDGSAFSAIHRQLDSMGDSVTFHDAPWYDRLSLIEQAQMIVVLTQEGQLELLRQLLLAVTASMIDVFAFDRTAIGLLAGQERLIPFCWREEAGKTEYILGDQLFERAKRINLRYAHLYEGKEENEETKEEAWQKLDTFTRYSNVSAADYHEMQMQILEVMGQPQDTEQMSGECLELLAELEHIRWCRYHYLNNWKWGKPENGKRKDPKNRIHMDLIPYNQLTEGEKEKDRENIRVLFSVK